MVGGTIVQNRPKPKKGGFGGLLGILLVLVLLAGAAVGAAFVYAQGVYKAAGPATADGAPRTVLIPPGSSAASIGKTLKDAGAINDETHFRYAVRAADRLWRPAEAPPGPIVLKAGEYAVPSGASLESLIGLLAKGSTVQHKLIIPEGLTVAEVLRRVEAMDVLTGELPKRPVSDVPGPAFLANGDTKLDDGEYPPEGSLSPGDFMVQRGETRMEVVQRMFKRQVEVVDELWEGRNPDIWVKTKEDLVKLASVVERETGRVPTERPLVAAAFNTRLTRGIPLQADATSLYGQDRGDNAGKPMTAAELRVATPYNSYENAGLPPTAIANPGREAIAATLKPADSKAIYFVTDGVTGGHKFAETLAEHERNIAALRQVRAQQAAEAARNGQPAPLNPAPKPARPAAAATPAAPTQTAPAPAASPSPAPTASASPPAAPGGQ